MLKISFTFAKTDDDALSAGGGYGAKLFRAGHIAGACAVGAHRTGRYIMNH